MLQHRPAEENVPATRLSSEEIERRVSVAESVAPDTISSLLWDNPMLAKELRRARRESWEDARSMLQQRLKISMIQGGAISAVGLGLFESQLVPRLSGDEHRVAWLLLFGFIAVIQAATAIVGAGTVGARIQGERMKQTWSAVLLTRLSPAQIVVGKVGASILPGLLGAASLIPAALWCLMRSGEPMAFLSTVALWPTILVASALTGLLSVRVALRGWLQTKKPGLLGAAAGAYWMGAPILGQVLATTGMVIAAVLSYLGIDTSQFQTPALVLFGLVMLPLIVVNPLAALFVALPWAWPGPGAVQWATAARVAIVLIHLGFSVHWTRKAWKSALADVPRSQPDLTP